MPRPFMNIAHRGFSAQYPENTLAAFEAAMTIGCTWLETDVRRTRDGRIVLLHDRTVDRTTDGAGEIADLAWEDVRRLDAGSWKGDRFRGERIPLLTDLLEATQGRAEVVIEIKLPPERVPEVVDLVRGADALDRTVASAFDWETLLRVRERAPEWRTTWLTRLDEPGADEAIRRCVEAGVDTFGPTVRKTHRALVEDAHEAGLLVRCWGLSDDRGSELRRLVRVGADGATTNHPDLLRAILREISEGD